MINKEIISSNVSLKSPKDEEIINELKSPPMTDKEIDELDL